MSDVQQISQDLQFVRSAVVRRERTDDGPPLILYLWAVYVIIGYPLMDFRPQYAGPFFAIGGIVGGILSWMIGKSYSRRIGQRDRAFAVRAALHFFGGIMLAMSFVIALSNAAPALQPFTGQMIVGLIGLLYFLWGVHCQRYFMLLGIVTMAGGAAVGLVPHFRWTLLGAVISLGLILLALLASRRHTPQEPGAIQTSTEAA